MLDTEKGLDLRHIRIEFAQERKYQYRIETSVDKEHWALLSDKTANKENIQVQQIEVSDKEKVRFIRISFPRNKDFVLPAISEVQVRGYVSD